MLSNQNYCDQYCVILNERKHVTDDCINVKAEIEDRNIRKADKAKLDATVKYREIYSEYNKQMKDKLGVVELIAQNVVSDLIHEKDGIKELDRVKDTQETIIKCVEAENRKLEAQVNKDILEIRNQFVDKWKSLSKIRDKFESNQKELDELCTNQTKLESEITKVRMENKKIRCCIKSLCECQTPSEVTQEMFDKLERTLQKLSKLTAETTSMSECYRQRMSKVQQEMNVTRDFSIKKLDSVKLFHEWEMEKLMGRKCQLEQAIVDAEARIQSPSKDVLKLRVDTNSRKLSQLEGAAQRLQNFVKEFSEKKRPCKQVKPSTKGMPKPKKVKKRIVPATDYLGSNFIKIL